MRDFEAKKVAPGPSPRSVRDDEGKVIAVPPGWVLVPPGDAALTRRLKNSGPTWVVQERKGRRTFSKGIWAESQRVESITRDLVVERSDPAHGKRQAQAKARREKAQQAYVEDFTRHVRDYLSFDHGFRDLEEKLAVLVTAHATPVGSGTVARTKRIPVNERAEAAVIAWLRHQTTAYDSMHIPRMKGKRREIRRMLAERSRDLLGYYRRGENPSNNCPLLLALQSN